MAAVHRRRQRLASVDGELAWMSHAGAECYHGLMSSRLDRNLGPQPLAAIMQERGLKATDLVAASEDQLTHKAVARALSGRWLTPHMQDKLRRALQRATGTKHALTELFTYAEPSRVRPPSAR